MNTAELALRSRKKFIGDMGYEIRTLMNGMVLAIDILDTIRNPIRSWATGAIRNSAFSLLRISEDIVDPANTETERLDIAVTKIDLYSLIKGAVATMKPMLEARNVRLALSIGPDLPTCFFSCFRTFVSDYS